MVRKSLVRRQRNSIVLAIFALLLPVFPFLVFASSAQGEVPFDGMYLKYECETTQSWFTSAIQVSNFTKVENGSTKMAIHGELWIDWELVDEWRDVIRLEDRRIVESTEPESIGLICGELYPVPLEVGDRFNITGPKTETISTRVTGDKTIRIIGKDCNCWVIEGTDYKSYAEKTTGVTVKVEQKFWSGEYWWSLEKITIELELIDTNIPNFPPPPQPLFIFQELPEFIKGTLNQFRSVFFPLACLLLVLGPICLAFRKTDHYYLRRNRYFARAGLGILFSGIGGALLSCYVFAFITGVIIGGFFAGIVWSYAIYMLIAKITKKKKEEMNRCLLFHLHRPSSTAPSPPTMQQTCPNCGTEIKPEMTHCPKCGQEIT